MASIPGIFNSLHLLAASPAAPATMAAAAGKHPLIQALAHGAPTATTSDVVAGTESSVAAAASAAPVPLFVAGHAASADAASLTVLADNVTLGAGTAQLGDVLNQSTTAGAVHLAFTATLFSATLDSAGQSLLSPTLTGAAGDFVTAPQAGMQVVQVHGGATVTFQSAEHFLNAARTIAPNHG